jgi:hypothetical protein
VGLDQRRCSDKFLSEEVNVSSISKCHGCCFNTSIACRWKDDDVDFQPAGFQLSVIL